VKPVSFFAAPPDEVAVNRPFEVLLGNGKEYLGKRRGGFYIINVEYSEREKIECVYIRTAPFEKPADNPEVGKAFIFAKCLFQVRVEKKV